MRGLKHLHTDYAQSVNHLFDRRGGEQYRLALFMRSSPSSVRMIALDLSGATKGREPEGHGLL
jgi:hypothetical protein